VVVVAEAEEVDPRPVRPPLLPLDDLDPSPGRTVGVDVDRPLHRLIHPRRRPLLPLRPRLLVVRPVPGLVRPLRQNPRDLLVPDQKRRPDNRLIKVGFYKLL